MTEIGEQGAYDAGHSCWLYGVLWHCPNKVGLLSRQPKPSEGSSFAVIAQSLVLVRSCSVRSGHCCGRKDTLYPSKVVTISWTTGNKGGFMVCPIDPRLLSSIFGNQYWKLLFTTSSADHVIVTTEIRIQFQLILQFCTMKQACTCFSRFRSPLATSVWQMPSEAKPKSTNAFCLSHLSICSHSVPWKSILSLQLFHISTPLFYLFHQSEVACAAYSLQLQLQVFWRKSQWALHI